MAGKAGLSGARKDTATAANIRRRMQSLAPHAMDRIKEQVEDGLRVDDKRLETAKWVIDHVIGKANLPIVGEDGQALTIRVVYE